MSEKRKKALEDVLNPAQEVRLVPSDYVYAVRGEWWDLLGERQYYDTVIHAITVMNLSSSSLSVESVTIEATVEGCLIQSLVLDQEELQCIAKPVTDRIQLGLRRLVDLMLWVDHVLPPEVELTSSAEMKSKTALVIPNIYLAYHRLPDALKITVDAKDEKGVCVGAEALLNVIEYQSKVKYTFPLEGRWFMKGMPATGVLDHHRFGASNEFGVDLLRLGPSGELFKDDGRLASDYYSFGAKVLAAVEGKVVAVNNSAVQEWSRFNPVEGETMEQFGERQMEEVRKALQGDVLHWAAGNYIVIEHLGSEYSAYLHLKENSVRVKVGETVRRGQHIADVGNTGDSYGAHLHFQVSDSPDLVNGRSLPFTFENIEIELFEPGQFVRAA